jgi:hypothetical protein
MVEHPRHDRIDHLLDSLWMGVKGWIRRQNGRPRQEQQLKVSDVNQVERRFARNQDKLFLLLQHDVRGAQEHVLAVTVRDPA